METGGHRGQHVQLAPGLGDLGLGLPQLLAELGDRLVSLHFARVRRTGRATLASHSARTASARWTVAWLTFASRARFSLVRAPSVC